LLARTADECASTHRASRRQRFAARRSLIATRTSRRRDAGMNCAPGLWPGASAGGSALPPTPTTSGGSGAAVRVDVDVVDLPLTRAVRHAEAQLHLPGLAEW